MVMRSMTLNARAMRVRDITGILEAKSKVKWGNWNGERKSRAKGE
jgi:hypothetical protein